MGTYHKMYGIFRLGNDPEIRYTPSGLAIANISGASDHSYKKDDEWQKETEWTKMTAFGRTAERIGEALKKGSLIFAEGRLKTDKWEDKEGVTRYSTGMIINKIEFLANFNKSEQQYGATQQPAPQQQQQQAQPSFGGASDDDIPF